MKGRRGGRIIRGGRGASPSPRQVEVEDDWLFLKGLRCISSALHGEYIPHFTHGMKSSEFFPAVDFPWAIHLPRGCMAFHICCRQSCRYLALVKYKPINQSINF